MTRVKLAVAGLVLGMAVPALAQDAGVHVRAARVLAKDPDALAQFYEKAFGMSETRRAANSATFKEIVINSGSGVEAARAAVFATIVITTRPQDSPVTNAASMPALILQVTDIQKTIDAVKANGGTLTRGPANSGTDLVYAFVKDPDGNLVELVANR